MHEKWLVVGAGPSGIAAVGALLDEGCRSENIVWVDPQFSVGDLGTAWKQVESNTPVSSFTDAFEQVLAFGYEQAQKKYFIDRMPGNLKCSLAIASQPLQAFTDKLKTQVKAYQDFATQITPVAGAWQVKLASGRMLQVDKIILALGAEAKSLNFPALSSIDLSLAASPNKLSGLVGPEDVVAVFGAYQSARTVEQNLAKTKVKKIYHFYRSQREFDNHIASLDLDERVQPVQISTDNFLKYIPLCNKAIYAVGFERRHVSIQGLPEDYAYNPETGQIAPGIFGVGIAFPEIMNHWMGRSEYKVSAVKPFVKRIKKLVPTWFEQPRANTNLEHESDTATLN